MGFSLVDRFNLIKLTVVPVQRVIKNGVMWFVFFTFLFTIEYYWGWTTVLAPWKALSPLAIVFSIALFLLSYQIRTWRLYAYFLPQTKGKWLTALRLILLHNILNNLLPARSGEVSFPLLMKRYFSVDYLHSVPALLWFRLLDLHTLLSIGILTWGIFWLLGHSILYLPLLIFWLILPLIFYTLKNTLYPRVSQPMLLKVLEGLPQHPAMFWRNWCLTWLNWLIKLALLVWLLGQFLPLDIRYLIGSVIAGELSSVLPFHAPGGIGTYEAGMVAPLLNVTEATVAAKAAINVHLFMLFSSIIGGVIGWLLPAPKDKPVG